VTPTSSSDVTAPTAATAPAAVATAPAAVATAPAAVAARGPVLLRRVARRAVHAVAVLLGSATAAFLAQQALPGDRATAILNTRSGQSGLRTAQELAPVVAQYHLDWPVWRQYADYVLGLLHGDLGRSYQEFRPVRDIIADQFGATLTLTLTAIALAWVISVGWVTATAGRSGPFRAVGEFVDTVTAGIPHYWLGIVLLLVFAQWLGWFPVIGGTGPDGLALPALTLAVPLAGFLGQATRSAFERTLDQPFVLSARLRGLGDGRVRMRHVLRHAVLPGVTLSGWALGATIAGAVVVETVFTRPGIGKVLVTAVGSQDLPVVTGVVVVITAVYVVANLLVDLAYVRIDPRLGDR